MTKNFIAAADVLIDFWNNAPCHPSTMIKDADYDILDKNKLFISQRERENGRGLGKIHENLPPEPYVGNIKNAKYYMISLNPRAGLDNHSYDAEYDNWKNVFLKSEYEKNIAQSNMDYPFYYLNPELKESGGGVWWTMVFGVANKSNEYKHILSQNFCDLELFPYHSNQWGGKLEELIMNNKIESCNKMLAFIDELLQQPDKVVFARNTDTLHKLLSKYKTLNFTNNNRRVWLSPGTNGGPDQIHQDIENILNNHK